MPRRKRFKKKRKEKRPQSTTTTTSSSSTRKKKHRQDPQKPYVCYLLQSQDGRKTYVGKTNDFERRIFEHNYTDNRGAKYTRGDHWSLVAHVEGFVDNSHVMQFEWRCHHPLRSIRNQCLRKGMSNVERRLFVMRSYLEQDAFQMCRLVFPTDTTTTPTTTTTTTTTTPQPSNVKNNPIVIILDDD